MGKDKKNLVISGKALLQSIIDQLAALFDEIIIVGCSEDEIVGIHGITGVYPDILDISASLTGIYTALLYSQSDYVYVTACDKWKKERFSLLKPGKYLLYSREGCSYLHAGLAPFL